MEAISTIAVVRGGRITFEVPAKDGTGFNVVLVPRRSPEEVQRTDELARRLRAETTAQAPDPDTLKRWEDEGRP